MASRKRTPNENQIGLSLPAPIADAATGGTSPSRAEPVDSDRSEPFDLESLDDYHEEPSHLQLVDPPRKISVIVEALDGGDFWISRLRDNGTTVASVHWTRSELEELIRRAQAALEI